MQKETYQNGTIQFYRGDCLEVFPLLQEEKVLFDSVITDIPYGTTKCPWDSVIDLPRMWEELSPLRKERTPVLLFSQQPFTSILGASNISELRYEIIYEKTAPTGHLNAKKMPMKAHENILVFYKKLPLYNPQKTEGHKPVNSFRKTIATGNNTPVYGQTKKEVVGGGNTDRYPRDVILFSPDKQRINLHPTQKPLALMEYLVKTYSKEGDLILDFAMGSATTAIACYHLNRRFIGIEKEKVYFDSARKRMEEALQGGVQISL